MFESFRKHCVVISVAMFATLLLVMPFFIDNVVTAVNGHTGIPLPIIMYHSVLKSSKRAGKYVVSPATFESDLVYLKENGFTTIVVKDLIDYVYNGIDLPDKPVMITLDDGYYNNLSYVMPILETLQMKAIISVVGEYTREFSETMDENPNYAHLTWDNLSSMVSTGLVEIQSHSYDFHNVKPREGSTRMHGETYERYRQAFMDDTMKLQELLKENCSIVPTAYTYPFGAISKESEDMLKEMGFSCSLGCYEHVNYIVDAESLFELGRYNRPSGISTREFMKKIIPK